MYLEPEGGFVTPQGNARKSNEPQTCVAGIIFPKLENPIDYRFAFDDEIPGFADAGRFGTFSEDEKALFLPQFETWYFGGNGGFPLTKAIARLDSNFASANLVIQKGNFNSVAPDSLPPLFRLREKPSGLTFGPASLYSSMGPYSADAISYYQRVAASVPSFPTTKFGIVIQKEDASMADEKHITFLKFLAAHEFGHALGLKDLGSSCSPASIMAHGGTSYFHADAPTELDKKARRLLLKIQ
jgi:hypothetical protein